MMVATGFASDSEYYLLFDMPHTVSEVLEIVGKEMPKPYRSWLSGKAIPKGAFKVPIQYEVETEDEIGAFYELEVPLMRKDLVEILTKCGAKNLQFYPVVLTATDSGRKIKDYFAVNVVGVVNAKMAKYECDGATYFKEGRIPAGAPKGLIIFRLQKKLRSRLVVARAVQEAILDNDDLKSVWNLPLYEALFDAKGTMLL